MLREVFAFCVCKRNFGEDFGKCGVRERELRFGIGGDGPN
jgi:hypothetical protein